MCFPPRVGIPVDAFLVYLLRFKGRCTWNTILGVPSEPFAGTPEVNMWVYHRVWECVDLAK